MLRGTARRIAEALAAAEAAAATHDDTLDSYEDDAVADAAAKAYHQAAMAVAALSLPEPPPAEAPCTGACGAPRGVSPVQSWRMLAYPRIKSCRSSSEGLDGSGGEGPFLLMAVYTRAEEFAVRDAVRRTWGREGRVGPHSLKRVFVVNAPGSPVIAAALDAEAAAAGDLLLLSPADSYDTLVTKSISLLHWFAKDCPEASFLLKTDGDVMLQQRRKLILTLAQQQQQEFPDHVYGAPRKGTHGGPVLRSLDNKNYQPGDIYPYALYPLYAAGGFYILSAAAAAAVVAVSTEAPEVYNEDVFVGLCLHRLSLRTQFLPLAIDFFTPPHPLELLGIADSAAAPPSVGPAAVHEEEERLFCTLSRLVAAHPVSLFTLSRYYAWRNNGGHLKCRFRCSNTTHGSRSGSTC
ncbi:hypothetical protein cyc_00064 [Cyclospora cayetanensis]|uniref:Hexosyltransferase n=1 Tax=Cyclospora cayetanensis TaxID=88456 RepID=A0A1D3CVJ2_9EIME|nr:hypothetical protein cyc_00064 [Cyclospora cayetanensis]